MAVVHKPTMNGDITEGPAISPHDDAFEAANLRDQITNIQKLIQLTQQKIESLNAKFGTQRNPDPLYVQEYEELANRIHELQENESQLMTSLEQIDDRESPPNSIPTEKETLPPQQITTPHHHTTTTNNVQQTVKAFLPNEQITTVSCLWIFCLKRFYDISSCGICFCLFFLFVCFFFYSG
ncbi:hypothetical protein KUTeg_020996 [Tegillarca granosa]|uniref:Uncharacterized protein n=1 Tax=Tegillarca granosa TaxID=220873 RepID=A0ABQ9EBY7_TEGGR|nr:hypothetical protein KUTeg_020996 [Tegillarca granosa]